jgi:alpha-D-ribose 1-methylphosphonate 5-triphosphate synthase subunit PhnG
MHEPDETGVIAGMDESAIEELLTLFADLELTVTSPPRTGLLMMTATDSFNSDFHLGEVLVTEATVLLEDTDGYGLVMGEAPRKALARAATDALLRSGGYTLLAQKTRSLLLREQKRQHAADAESAAMTAATRVNFDLMPGV